MKKYLLIILLLNSLNWLYSNQTRFAFDHRENHTEVNHYRNEDELLQFIESITQTHLIPGLSISIVKDDRIVWEKYFGYSNINQNTLVDENTMFILSSISKTITVTALMQLYEENLFMLDPTSCGGNLVLTNSNMVVTNTVNKKWNAVRASTSFSNGVHYWEVHIDKCVSKNIFVGIMTENGSTDNYVGSDREGWGYLANKAIWHNKGKMCTYGELFREGDHIGVTLDMDCGTVAFSRNGKDLGVAVEGVAGEIYPAFSLYNIDDQVSLIPTSSTASNRIEGKRGKDKIWTACRDRD